VSIRGAGRDSCVVFLDLPVVVEDQGLCVVGKKKTRDGCCVTVVVRHAAIERGRILVLAMVED
jgi:hypothetical protein